MSDVRTWVAEVDLARSSRPSGVVRPPATDDAKARVLVRLHGQVLGFVDVPLEDGQVPSIGTAVREQLGEALARADRKPPPPLRAAETIGVVVCTRERPSALARCLKLLQELRYPSFEVVVVDNAPVSDDTRDCFERMVGDDTRFRYVREPEPGLSRARNRGLDVLATRIAAFTDDDVLVDPWWLHGIARGFARDDRCACVTGLAAAAELDDPAQRYFDRRYSWASRFDARVYDMDGNRDDSPLYPFSAGIFGTGANFAVDRAHLRSIGGFDAALGAGTPSRGGEDLDAFVRILLSGRSIVYEPSALVWHAHRADPEALRRQLFAYGTGLTAFLAKHVTDPRTRRQVLARVPKGLSKLAGTWRSESVGGRVPVTHALVELAGMGAGPFVYLRAQRAHKGRP